MAVVKIKLDQSVDDAKEATKLKYKSVEDKVDVVTKQVTNLETKLGEVSSKINLMDTRVAIIGTEQKFMAENMNDLRDDTRRLSTAIESFGRVIRKP